MKNFITKVKGSIKRISNPVFYISLMFAALLWFVTKMSNEYRETIILPISIEQQTFEVACNVQASGYQLLVNNMFPRSRKIEFELADLGMSRTTDTSPYIIVTPHALSNAISGSVENMRILSVSTTLYVKRNKDEN